MAKKLTNDNPQLPKTQGQRRTGNARMFTDMERLKREAQAASEGAFNMDATPTRVTPPSKHRNVSSTERAAPNIARGRKFAKP